MMPMIVPLGAVRLTSRNTGRRSGSWVKSTLSTASLPWKRGAAVLPPVEASTGSSMIESMRPKAARTSCRRTQAMTTMRSGIEARVARMLPAIKAPRLISPLITRVAPK